MVRATRIARLVAIFGALLLLAFTFTVLAAGSGAGPQLLFTDNIDAQGTSLASTTMEQALLDRLDGATTSIDAAIYDLDRASVRDALIAAAGRGVAVRVVTDDETFAGDPYYAHLQAAGITVVNDARSSIMHNKFFVIDEQVVWTGSTNMSNRDFSYNHNNSLVMTSTLLADIYTIEFEEMFAGDFGTHKTDNVTHTVDYNGVPIEIYFSPTDAAMGQVLDEVQAASDSIHFSIFFFTDDELGQAIIDKAQQGLTVSGIWDALGAGNQFSEDETLCDAGVPIKVEDFGGVVHNKFMIVDANGLNPRVITGSMNWSSAGDGANDENTLIVRDAATAQQYLAAYEELWNALGEHTLCVAGGEEDFFVFLPVVRSPLPTPVPTPTPDGPTQPTPTNTPQASPTPTTTPTPTPTSQPAGNVVITHIEYDGDQGPAEPDEYVQIRNDHHSAIQLQGWTLEDEANHVFTFPSFLMQPGQVCRVYTNEDHPEWCGFSYGSGSAIWNNSGDCATLKDSGGGVVDRVCY